MSRKKQKPAADNTTALNPDDGIVKTQVRVAKFFNVHDKTVRRWIKDAMPREPDGRYNIFEILNWLNLPANKAKLDKLDPKFDFKNANPDNNKNQALDIKHWECLDRRFRALIKELDYKEKKGELIPREEVITAFVYRFEIVKKRLMTLARSLGPMLAAEKNPKRCEQYINKEVTRILKDFRSGTITSNDRFNEIYRKFQSFMDSKK